MKFMWLMLGGCFWVIGIFVFAIICLIIARNKLRSNACFFLGMLGFIGIIIVLLLKDYRPYLDKAGIKVVRLKKEEYDKNNNSIETYDDVYYYKNQKITLPEVRVIISQYLTFNNIVDVNNENVIPVKVNEKNNESDLDIKLKEIKNLYDKKMITKAEYDSKRKSLLDKY